MKKIFKELLRFLSIILIFGITAIFIPDPVFGILLITSFFITFILACCHKVSKAWAIDIILLILFYMTVSFLANVFEEYQEKEANHYAQLLKEFKNTPITIPDETVFDGMKRYSIDDVDIKSLKDGIAYDKNHQPLNGVTINEMPNSITMTSSKNGKRDGYAFFIDKKNDKKFILSSVFSRNGKILSYQEFYRNGKLKFENKLFDNYILGRAYYKNGQPMVFSLSVIKPQNNIIRVYNRRGRLIEEINTFKHYGVCLKEDGTTRPLTKKEIHEYFNIREKFSYITSS